MTTINQDLALNPDLFASEVHFCLLNDGTRSRALRQLWRVAKGNSELERILEIKVAEFRRALREGRTPTYWNLPTRAWEWLSDNARFTPPREVLTTLAYVAVMLVGVDALKSRVPWSQWTQSGRANAASVLRPNYELDSFRPSTNAESQSASKVDEWLAAELKRAAESAELSDLLAQRVTDGLNKLPLDEMVARKIDQAVSAEQPSQPADSAESKAAIQEALQKWFASDEFNAIVSGAVQKALSAKDPATTDKNSTTTTVATGEAP